MLTVSKKTVSGYWICELSEPGKTWFQFVCASEKIIHAFKSEVETQVAADLVTDGSKADSRKSWDPLQGTSEAKLAEIYHKKKG